MTLARLKESLKHAVTRRLVTMNVAENVFVPRRARKAARKTKSELIPWNVKAVPTFVHLEAGTLMVANTRTMMGNKTVVEKDTKSMAGERALPLPGPVWSALKRYKALQAKEKLSLGEARNIKQLRRRTYRLMENLGLRQVRLYDARSSCMTYLADNGVPDHILARWAGHTNVKTTKRWYVKPDVEDLRGAATTWDGLHGFEGVRAGGL